MDSVTSLNDYSIYYNYTVMPNINYTLSYQYSQNICPYCGSSSVFEKDPCLTSGKVWECSDCKKEFISPIVLTYLNNSYSYGCGAVPCNPCPHRLPCSCDCCPWKV